jgi:hypothetical protein
MKLQSMSVFLTLGAAVAALGAEPPSRQFGASCADCHQPPDLEFSTDRAWLDQVKRTA